MRKTVPIDNKSSASGWTHKPQPLTLSYRCVLQCGGEGECQDEYEEREATGRRPPGPQRVKTFLLTQRCVKLA